MTEEVKNDYGFYSKVLKKPFDTLEELKAAEGKLKEEKKVKEQREEDAKKVNAAYADYIEANKKAKQMVTEAYNKYENLRQEFSKKYKYYHQTYTTADGKETYSITEFFTDNMLSDFADIVNKYLGK